MSSPTTEIAVPEPKTPSLTAGEAREIQAFAWPDVWASNLRLEVDSKTFHLKGREYQLGILRDDSPTIINPKGAQMGLTTVFTVKSCHAVVKRGWTVLYLLPKKAGSVMFVQGRIDPMIDSSPLLQREFKRVDNRNQKVTIGGAKWYIRGTNIASELREVPADVLVIDERDVANEDNLSDAYARLDGSDVQRAYELSTPTVDGYGVYGDDGWKSSDQMQWYVACPRCNHKQVIDFESNVQPHLGATIESSHESCRCQRCNKPFSNNDRAEMNATGEWVAANPGASLRGYHISQLNSPTKQLAHPKFGILVNWFKGQSDAGKLRDFYNLGLGLPYASPSDKFTAQLLDNARKDYNEGVMPDGQLCIGIDQGVEVLHVTVWSKRGTRFRLLKALTITGDGKSRTKWTVLKEEVLSRYSGWTAVCDAHPDKEDCEQLSKEYPGQFWMGFEKDRPEQDTTAAFSREVYGESCEVRIDRTAAFDSYIKCFLDGNANLPKEARDLGEIMPDKPYNGFYHQHFQMVHVYQYDAANRLVARWVNGGPQKTKDKTKAKDASKSGNRPDHWMHSGMFALTASMKDAPLVVSPQVGAMFASAGGLIGRSRR